MFVVVVAVGGLVVVDVLNKTLLPKIVQISCAEKKLFDQSFFSRGFAVDAVDVDVASHDASQDTPKKFRRKRLEIVAKLF